MEKRSTFALVLAFVLVLALLGCDEKKTPAGNASSPSASSAPATASAPASAAAATPPPSASAVPDAIAAQHVLVAWKGAQNAPKTVTRTKADAKNIADDVATRAKNGEDFGALVAAYSDDPGSKERQGSLGKFGRDKMVKPFSDAAFALPVGGVSGVVETPFGYHVIKRNQ